jgi:hypothetical protein
MGFNSNDDNVVDDIILLTMKMLLTIIIIVMIMMLLTIIVMGRWVLETPLRGCCILWITTEVLASSNKGAPSSSNREAGLLTTRWNDGGPDGQYMNVPRCSVRYYVQTTIKDLP